MIKRLIDVCGSMAGLILMGPVLMISMFMIWRQDGHSPFYAAPRVGKGGRLFIMVKLRSMIIGTDKTGVDSTAGDDARITPIGHFVRRFKLDEFTQLWNVLKGEMSLVGPRPNVKRETDLYTKEEKNLLTVAPGITDIASIIFADENEILKDSQDPDIDYNQLIRPWKSRLGLIYIANRSLRLDLELIFLTVVGIASRRFALVGVNRVLHRLNAPEKVIRVAQRMDALVPHPPPGADEIVKSR